MSEATRLPVNTVTQRANIEGFLERVRLGAPVPNGEWPTLALGNMRNALNLLDEIEHLREMLRVREWTSVVPPGEESIYLCQSCYAEPEDGHTTDCPIPWMARRHGLEAADAICWRCGTLRDKAIGAYVGWHVGLDIAGPMHRLGALLERLDRAELDEALERERARRTAYIDALSAPEPGK